MRALTGLAGVVLLACALAIVAYALAADQRISDLGWLLVIAFGLLGPLLLRRSARWNEPRFCPHCGAAVPRSLAVCPRCGLSFEAPTWAAIGKLKLP